MTDQVSNAAVSEQARSARAKKLEDTFNLAMRGTLRSCALEKLTSCFPTLAQNDMDTLRDAQEQLSAYLADNCDSEFKKILKERNVITRLNELDEIINDAKERRDRGIASGRALASELPADVILRAYLLPSKRAELQSIGTSIEHVQKGNADSLETIEQQRRTIELRTRELRDALQTLDNVVSSTNSTNQELQKSSQALIV